jgi:hypothetical protein
MLEVMRLVMHSGCMTSRRISVTLDAPDQQALEVFADPSRPEHATLEAWAGQHGLSVRDASDAAILRTLVRAGAAALREKALEDGYARLAEQSLEEQQERRALRDRAVRKARARFAE